MNENQQYLKKAQTYAEEFEDKNEPELLKQACSALENVLLLEEGDPTIRSQLRTDSLYLWLRLIQLLDSALDPDFEPADVPERAVQPPRTSKGVVYPPGADPALIDDAKARAKYEEAIAANQSKTTHYVSQTKLRRMDEHITPRAKGYIRNFYTPASGDQEELKTAISEIIKTPRRKADFMQLLTQSQP